MKNIHNTISNPLDAMLHHIAFNMALHDVLEDIHDDLKKARKAERNDGKEANEPEKGHIDIRADKTNDDLPVDVNAFLRENHYEFLGLFIPKPHLECADGYSVFIQAGDGSNLHCWPQGDNDEYTHVEVGHPSVVDEELTPYYFEDDEEEKYSFVPVAVMNKILIKHGGITAIGDEAEHLVGMLKELAD